MGWRAAVLVGAGCVLLVGTGCPENHRKDGNYDRATRKDIRQQYLLDEEGLPVCEPGKAAHLMCEAEVCTWECK
jgi:coenzyme F420-reducing hydrogenase delta subunit